MSQYKLIPMTDSDYAFWSKRSRENYRDEKMKANGYTFSEAQKIADDSFQRLLPDGLKTKDQFLFTVRGGEEVLGFVWFALTGVPDNRKAFLYDIIIEEKVQGKGVGRAAMKLLEVESKKVGARSICLHVFGNNERAIHLYQSLGYLTTDISMEKAL